MTEHETPAGSAQGAHADGAATDADLGSGAPAATSGPDITVEADPAPSLRRILEAILLVVDEPVTEVDLAQVVEAPRRLVGELLAALRAEYLEQGRGFELREVAGGWRFYTAEDCAAYVERFVLEGTHARLTQAALETLAVVAYRQPVTRQTVAAIRGVNVDGVIRTLLSRGLIAESGLEQASQAHLYTTTPYFLERLGMASLDQLPSLAPLLPDRFEDLEADV